MKRLSLIAIVCLLPIHAFAAPPNELVEGALQLLQTELAVRKDVLAEDTSALYAFVDGVLRPRLNRKLAAQLVLGKHWRTATASQRQRFIEAFYAALLQRYADGILQFDPEQFEVLPYHGDVSKRRTTVKTKVRLDDGTAVPVNYSLVAGTEGWQAYDVVIEGISYVRNFRAEIDSEIRSTSLDAVIKRLESESHNDERGQGRTHE